MAAHLLGRAAKKPAPDAGVAAVTDDDQVGTLVIGGPHDLLGGMAGADVGLHGHAAPGRVVRRLLKQLGAGLLLEEALLLDLADRGAVMGEVGLDGQADQLGTVAAAFGSGLLLAAELAAWSVDPARTGSEPARLVRRRVVTLAALVLGSAAFSDAVMVSAAQRGDRQGLLMRRRRRRRRGRRHGDPGLAVDPIQPPTGPISATAARGQRPAGSPQGRSPGW